MRMDIPSKFKFELFPDLLPVYKEYRKLRLKATSLSRKDFAKAAKKYEEAALKRDNYACNVLSKMIYDIFNPLCPTLKNADQEVFVKWNDIFNCSFEQMTVKQKRYLVGLVEGDYIYELPLEYYNN